MAHSLRTAVHRRATGISPDLLGAEKDGPADCCTKSPSPPHPDNLCQWGFAVCQKGASPQILWNSANSFDRVWPLDHTIIFYEAHKQNITMQCICIAVSIKPSNTQSFSRVLLDWTEPHMFNWLRPGLSIASNASSAGPEPNASLTILLI